MIYTDEHLQSLIACRKRVVTRALKTMRMEGKQRRNDMTVESLDGLQRFHIFIRQSDEFEENFTIGLRYHAQDEARSFTLIRCNGKHGGQRLHPHHATFHVHRVTADDLNNGIDSERHIEETNEYASLQEALSYFFRLIELDDAESYFPGLHNQWLFTDLLKEDES